MWSISHTSAGASHPGNRHVKSRHRTNSANAVDGRYPDSGFPSGTVRGFSLADLAKSRTDSAGKIPNPGKKPG